MGEPGVGSGPPPPDGLRTGVRAVQIRQLPWEMLRRNGPDGGRGAGLRSCPQRRGRSPHPSL